MAQHYKYDDPHVGDLVYAPYSPQKAGKIVEVVGRIPSERAGYVCPFFKVKVRWAKDGKIEVVDSGQLNDFKSLVDDHEKKLATHKAMLAKLEAL